MGIYESTVGIYEGSVGPDGGFKKCTHFTQMACPSGPALWGTKSFRGLL